MQLSRLADGKLDLARVVVVVVVVVGTCVFLWDMFDPNSRAGLAFTNLK